MQLQILSLQYMLEFSKHTLSKHISVVVLWIFDLYAKFGFTAIGNKKYPILQQS